MSYYKRKSIRFHLNDVLNILCTRRLLKHNTFQINNATVINSTDLIITTQVDYSQDVP